MKNKPYCKLIGSDGNIFNLLAIASKCLNTHGYKDEAAELKQRILVKQEAKSYHRALEIIMEYVEVT